MGEPIVVARGAIGKVVAIHLPGGTELVRALREVAEKEGIRSGIIWGGPANLSKLVVRTPKDWYRSFPITDEQRYTLTREDPMELLSLIGNISFKENSELVIHAHAIVCTARNNPGLTTFGGHLVEAIVYTTAELTIAEVVGMEFQRVRNPTIYTEDFHPVAKE